MLTKYASKAAVLAAVMLGGQVWAQQTATMPASTTCTQTGTQMQCVTTVTTIYTLPASVNLSSSAPGNFTLTGGSTNPSGPLANCAIGGSYTNIATGSTPTLTVSCAQGTPVSYAWTVKGLARANSTASLMLTAADTATPGDTFGVSVTATDANSVAVTSSVTVTTATSAPVAVSGCSLNGSVTGVAVGSTPSLTLSCTQGSPTSYVWTVKGVARTNNAATLTLLAGDTTPAGTSFTVTGTASNATSTGPTVSATVTVAAASSGAVNYCGGTTPSITESLNAGAGMASLDTGGMGGTNNHIVRLDVPSTASAGTARLTFTHKPGSESVTRMVTISKNLCDFTQRTNETYVISDGSLFTSSGFVSINVQNARFPLTTGTWYINIKNTSCSSTSCPARLDWLK